MKHWTQTRNAILFLGGLVGVIHETLFSHTDRPTLLILFAAMMGLPAFLGRDGGGDDKPPIIIFKEKDDEKDDE